MSYTAIADVGRTLVDLLRVGFGYPQNSTSITLESPAAVAPDTRVSLFLYRIVENPDLKNEPMRILDARTSMLPPLSLNLHYLVTGYASPDIPDPALRRLEAQEILGKAMRILYDNGIIAGTKLRGSLATREIDLRITLNPMTIEDLTRIWSVFPQLSYQTSVSYLVTPVPIESQRSVSAQRVLSKEADHDHMVHKPEET
jgi:hypothetical protein